MRVRRYNPKDAAAVDEIYQRCHGHFDLPQIKHCVDLAIVENNRGEIVALGAFQLVPEVILVLDKAKPKKEQASAIDELFSAADLIAALYGYDFYRAFPDGIEWADVLRKHYNFKDVLEPVLVKVVNDGE